VIIIIGATNLGQRNSLLILPLNPEIVFSAPLLSFHPSGIIWAILTSMECGLWSIWWFDAIGDINEAIINMNVDILAIPYPVNHLVDVA
jgi:hypothetical protein